MSSFDLFLNYMSRSGFFTFVILAWLSLYFVITFALSAFGHNIETKMKKQGGM